MPFADEVVIRSETRGKVQLAWQVRFEHEWLYRTEFEAPAGHLACCHVPESPLVLSRV